MLNKFKKYIFLCFVFLLFAAGCSNNQPIATKIDSEQPYTKSGDIVIYYDKTCSHCQQVESHIKNNKLNQLLPITLKEAFIDDASYKEFTQVANGCDIPLYQFGVPLAWDGTRCYRGSDEIIKYLGFRMQQLNK